MLLNKCWQWKTKLNAETSVGLNPQNIFIDFQMKVANANRGRDFGISADTDFEVSH